MPVKDECNCFHFSFGVKIKDKTTLLRIGNSYCIINHQLFNGSLQPDEHLEEMKLFS